MLKFLVAIFPSGCTGIFIVLAAWCLIVCVSNKTCLWQLPYDDDVCCIWKSKLYAGVFKVVTIRTLFYFNCAVCYYAILVGDSFMLLLSYGWLLKCDFMQTHFVLRKFCLFIYLHCYRVALWIAYQSNCLGRIPLVSFFMCIDTHIWFLFTSIDFMFVFIRLLFY